MTELDIHKDKLDGLMTKLPAINRPTVSPLYGSDYYAVNTVVDEVLVREIIPDLLAAGAEGIVEYPLNKVVADRS